MSIKFTQVMEDGQTKQSAAEAASINKYKIAS